MHFLKPNQALVANNKINHEKEPHVNSMTSNDNNCDEQAHIIAIMIGPAANAAYFVSKKTSHLINKISYIAS
jgi:hypothetical protein